MQQTKSQETQQEKDSNKNMDEKTENKETETAVHSNENEKKEDIDSNTEIKEKDEEKEKKDSPQEKEKEEEKPSKEEESKENPEQKKNEETKLEEKAEKAENESPQREITVNAIQKNAKKWGWDERISLVEAKKILREAEELDEEFRAYNKKIIDILKKLIDFLDNKLNEIMDNAQGYAISTQMNLIYNFISILDKAIYNYRLSCGRSTDNKELKHQGEVEVSNVSNENIFVYSAEEMERIQNIQEMDEETKQFLDEL